MSEYLLPDLAYDPAALEPHLSGEIVELHHDKHHAAYVKGANTALEKLAEARAVGQLRRARRPGEDAGLQPRGPRAALDVLGEPLAPTAATSPTASWPRDRRALRLVRRVQRAASARRPRSVQGSGWGIFSWEPIGERLIIEQIYDHQENTTLGRRPAAGHRRVGARLLPAVQEPQAPTTSRRSGTSSTGPTSPADSPPQPQPSVSV